MTLREPRFAHWAAIPLLVVIGGIGVQILTAYPMLGPSAGRAAMRGSKPTAASVRGHSAEGGGGARIAKSGTSH